MLCLWEILKAVNGGREVTANERASKIVRKAIDLVAANHDKVIGLVEICETLGVSLRSLHYAFQEIANTSPAKWLRLIRLNRVHRLLSSAGPGDVQVKRVALENGFEHLGHFGQQYRAHFGCRPVDTLRS
nr:helix-turn-helix domain-containing protein [Ruegeria arenilitoris]